MRRCNLYTKFYIELCTSFATKQQGFEKKVSFSLILYIWIQMILEGFFLIETLQIDIIYQLNCIINTFINQKRPNKNHLWVYGKMKYLFFKYREMQPHSIQILDNLDQHHSLVFFSTYYTVIVVFTSLLLKWIRSLYYALDRPARFLYHFDTHSTLFYALLILLFQFWTWSSWYEYDA